MLSSNGMKTINYAPAQHWDQRYTRLHQNGDDLDWGTQWTNPFLEPLKDVQGKYVLDLGCGSGNDVIRLVHEGFHVIGFDYSQVAIANGAQKAIAQKVTRNAQFIVGDMAQRLPFVNSTFDAVMSNVAAHMFSDEITRSLFTEIWRIVGVGGLFLFHLNAIEDRSLRSERWPPEREIEPNYVLEKYGQTMRFFSQEYLHELLADWSDVNLELIEINARETGEPFKRAWRGIAKK
ncbi:MAG: class I SAM-dependent methyltransferase [Chloroflexota bacterium]